MNSSPPGAATSVCEVTNISTQGFWLLVDDAEYFVPFADCPIFRKATVEQVFAVERLSPRQLHWPALDADVELDALEHPGHYPLVWRD